MFFSFASCSKKEEKKPDDIPETTAYSEPETTLAVSPDVSESETEVNPEESTAPAEETSAPADDPSQWTNEQIIEFYKAAAT